MNNRLVMKDIEVIGYQLALIDFNSKNNILIR